MTYEVIKDVGFGNYKPLKIGNLKLNNNLVMAPLAGITDVPFRTMAKEGGAGLVCTEMISAKALHRGDKKTFNILKLSDDEHPVSVQIFGSDPTVMAEAAKIIEGYGADILDINFGCPVPKIVKNGAGSKLLDNYDLMSRIMQAVVKNVKIPVSIKIRIGKNINENIAPVIVKIAEECGVKMVVIHGRAVSVGHKGEADLAAIAEAVAVSKIPVVGNGGIKDETGAKKFLDITGCAGLMLGRSAIGDPEIFARIDKYLINGKAEPALSWEKRINYLKKNAQMAVSHYGEKNGLIRLRKLANYYIKGLPNSAYIRNQFNKIVNMTELDSLISEILRV